MSRRLTRGSWAASPLKSLNVWVPGGQVWHNRLWNYSIIFVHKHTQTHTHTHTHRRTTEGESDTREGASKERRSKRSSRRLPVTWHPIIFSQLLRRSDATEAEIKAANCHSLRREQVFFPLLPKKDVIKGIKCCWLSEVLKMSHFKHFWPPWKWTLKVWRSKTNILKTSHQWRWVYQMQQRPKIKAANCHSVSPIFLHFFYHEDGQKKR